MTDSHGIHVDLASAPWMKANNRHQCIYLDGNMTAWLDVDPCQGEDPDSADLAAGWLDTLSAEAANLADWYRSQARHARGTCPPVCDSCGRCRCQTVETPGLHLGFHWEVRHAGHPAGTGAMTCAIATDSPHADPAERCACTATGTRCCEHRNAKDGKCEPCRRRCP